MIPRSEGVDWERFEREADTALMFVDDGARPQIVLQATTKYAPAALMATTPEALTRAWDAFHFYLTARATMRKPWQLPPGEAEQVIATAKSLLAQLTGDKG